MAKCNNHAELSERVAKIEANTEQILITISRIEERVYAEHGARAGLAGAFFATTKTTLIAASIGAAIATAINAVVG